MSNDDQINNGFISLPEERVNENLERVANYLQSVCKFKGIFPSEDKSRDPIILDTVKDPDIGDIYVLKDTCTGKYRHYVYTGEWVRMHTTIIDDLNMTIVDLLEYLYDIKEYLDSRTEPQKYRTCAEACEDYHKDFKTASDMVQFIIDKIITEEETNENV